MGTLSGLRPGIGAGDLAAAAQLVPAMPIASPWAGPSHLASIVWADIFGAGVPAPLTRAEAMRVPAVARSRHIICSTIGRIQLRAYKGDSSEPLADQPSWITSTSGPMSAFHRQLWTADDLLFYGWSLWARTLNDATGRVPLQMDRVPMEAWRVVNGRIERDYGGVVGWQPMADADVVLIPGMHEGLLSFGAESIRHAADLQRAAGRAAKNPAAHLALKQTGGDALSRDAIQQLVSDWAAARNGENGGVAYLNQSIEAQELGTFDKHLVIDGRNAAAVDIARHASLPADLIDATTEGSLTYSNSRDNDRRGIDYGTGGYMSAISARLTQDDVTVRGTRIAFDLEEWLTGTVPGQPASPTTPAPGPSSSQPPVPAPATAGETAQ